MFGVVLDNFYDIFGYVLDNLYMGHVMDILHMFGTHFVDILYDMLWCVLDDLYKGHIMEYFAWYIWDTYLR